MEKAREAGKVLQVIEGGGVQVGTCEAKEVPTEHTQKKHLSMCILYCITSEVPVSILGYGYVRTRSHLPD